MKPIYVTCTYDGRRKIAYECLSEEEAYDTAHDLCSYACVKNVRIRKCGKPNGREILYHGNYAFRI